MCNCEYCTAVYTFPQPFVPIVVPGQDSSFVGPVSSSTKQRTTLTFTICIAESPFLSECILNTRTLMQCCGSGMIYSGSGSSFEFSEIRIQAKVPDPCGSGSNLYKLSTVYFEIIQKQSKRRINNFLPFSIQ